MNQEKLIIEEKRNIIIIFFLIIIFSNVLFYVNGHVFNIKTVIEARKVNVVVGLASLFMWKYVIPYTRVTGAINDIQRIRKEMRVFKLAHILIVGYIFAVCFWINNLDITISAIIGEIELLQIYFLTRYKKSLRLSDVQLKWKKAWLLKDYSDMDSNVLWRLKLWFGKYNKCAFRERYKRFNLLGGSIFVVLCVLAPCDPVFIGLIILLLGGALGHPVLYFIDMSLGLFIDMNGMCTGKIKKEISKKNNLDAGGGLAVSIDGKRHYYYCIYITDFKNKREIKIRLKECDYIDVGKEYTVVHGFLSKRAIKIKGVNVEFWG